MATVPRRNTSPVPTESPTPQISWPEFLDRLDWRQGEHVTLIGPTGQGKTTLATQLLTRRAHIAVFATKRRDDTMTRLKKHGGYRVVKTWRPEVGERLILWPGFGHFDDVEKQREIFYSAMGDIFQSGGWCIFWDEATYLSDFLKLKTPMSVLWQQGRSLGVSIVAATQRPAYIPLYAYDQATHLFLWRDNDDVNLKRLANIGGMDPRQIRSEIQQLAKHEVLYINVRTGEKYRTTPEV